MNWGGIMGVMKAKLIREQESRNIDFFEMYMDECLRLQQEREMEDAFCEWLAEMYCDEQDDLAMLEPK